MDLLKQLSIIITINFLGEIICLLFPFSIPSNIIGFSILFISLYFKLLRIEHIKDISVLFITNIGFFFIPSSVSIINNFEILKNIWWKIILICSLSSIITLISTAYFIKFLISLLHKNE